MSPDFVLVHTKLFFFFLLDNSTSRSLEVVDDSVLHKFPLYYRYITYIPFAPLRRYRGLLISFAVHGACLSSAHWTKF